MASVSQEIAIIGSGCRFPGGADSPSKLWALLRDPRVVASHVPALKGYYHENGGYHGHTHVKEAYLLSEDGEHKQFDAGFFGISALEASVLDPQIRLLLETVYEALEAGGQTIDQLKGTDTAVYAGQMVNDYELLMHRDSDNLGKYHATGTARTMLSNRVSYFYDWHGPSMTLDTACSSSLVALHLAVEQLRSGRSKVAVVAGSNLLLDPGSFIAETNMQMLSPDGRSRMWDAKADGYARGEGVAALVLKSRSAAEADGDSIECIIRNTAVNQDGKTPGQTMPNASAQTQLIKECYMGAGLDISDPAERPHYFEAHGTGTSSGDPIEAEAIHSAFFSHGPVCGNHMSIPLLVGSIKTVVGHTEGAAGIAGILKASLALQNSTIPPNLLFDKLNPNIKPYYHGLQIPTVATPWPESNDRGPRRVSVNSFGFGGTNAHAILESYSPPTRNGWRDNTTLVPVTMPFVFSAASEASLRSYLYRFCEFVRAMGNDINLRETAFCLSALRTRFSVAMAISASTPSDLCEKIEGRLQTAQADKEHRIGMRATHGRGTSPHRQQVLGVFTGQGAQWAQMGWDLVKTSASSRKMLQRLQSRLDALPSKDRPSWSLFVELGKDGSSSRIMDAEISQPLCTAIQIIQVDLLRAADIQMSVVVGHSSGEIAAAYAANLITAEEAICIAYYRGLYAKLAKSDNGQPGAMIAVATSQQDAEELLRFPEFDGRACVAAVNSKNSVTLSGDQDAIEELRIIFDDEGKLPKVLKVDTAYHSHHMRAASSKYLESLLALNLQTGDGGRATWVSSVTGTVFERRDLQASYWETNMSQPVLFLQAVESAFAMAGSFDLLVELGPHPALKGPTLQTAQEQTSLDSPYTGLFSRGRSSIMSLAEGLGHAWTHLGTNTVNLAGFDQALTGIVTSTKPGILKDLPKYAWDHKAEYWHESRYARATRLRPGPVHELLGHLTPDSNEQDMRWRQVLRLAEVPWLAGHRLQNVVVFPASGYVASVIEACSRICKNTPIRLIEILDMRIVSALMFDPEDMSVEIILSVTGIVKQDSQTIEAEFKYHASTEKAVDKLELKSSGRIRIQCGNPCPTALPARPPERCNLLPVDETQFYSMLTELEYQYGGPFRALWGLKRRLGAASACVSLKEPSSLPIHPAALDAAFQSLSLTYAMPEDGSHKTMHLPRSIKRIIVNPAQYQGEFREGRSWSLNVVQPLALPHLNMVGDIDIYPDDSDHAMVQVQELECAPFSQQSTSDGDEVFSKISWGLAHPSLASIVNDKLPTSGVPELGIVLERLASFYLRQLSATLPESHPCRNGDSYKGLFDLATNLTLPSLPASQTWPVEWLADTPETLKEICQPFEDTVDLRLLWDIGSNISDIVTGEKSPAILSRQAKLSDWRNTGTGISECTTRLAKVMGQIVHRYPQMHILEFSADSSTATATILQEVGSKFASYTVSTPTSTSDSSEGSGFSASSNKISHKPSDLANDLLAQGFSKGAYDVVVTSLTLHKQADLGRTLRSLRSLLKPGGYLLVLELLPSFSPFIGVVLGACQDWWTMAQKRGGESPVVTLQDWDILLRENGFSGIDSSTTESCGAAKYSVFVSQAVNEYIIFLRDPLSQSFPSLGERQRPMHGLIILGGASSTTQLLSSGISEVLRPYYHSIRCFSYLTDFLDIEVIPGTDILSLVDLDTSVFEQLEQRSWDAVRKLVLHTGTLIWLSHGRRATNPHANMMVGLIRGAVRDNPGLEHLLLDAEDIQLLSHRVVASSLLRYKAATQWSKEGILHQFSTETEQVLDERGDILIPRLVMDDTFNRRYNSGTRDTRRQIMPQQGNIGISATGKELDLVLEPSLHCQEQGGLQFQTTHSLLSPTCVSDRGSMFLMFGKDIHVGTEMIALSFNNHLFPTPPEDLIFPIQLPLDGCEAQVLWLTAHYLLSSVVFKDLSEDDAVLIHEASQEAALILAKEAKSLGVKLTFTATSPYAASLGDASWILIHPACPQRDIAFIANRGFSAFVDLGSSEDAGTVAGRLAATLPMSCQQYGSASSPGGVLKRLSDTHSRVLQHRLREAVSKAVLALTEIDTPWLEYQVPALPIGAMARNANNTDTAVVVEWDTSSSVSVKVEPVDKLVTFSDSKTYWLVGLVGGLGMSLCEWMVERGARHFVMSSRTPEISKDWLEEMRGRGTDIVVATCDVTQKDEVMALVSRIGSAMPPIGGVAQGVMVLQDANIRDMTLQQLLSVTHPKVDGSIHLNEVLEETPLDFFVFFSSIASITGNYGQANYAAANQFMASLAEQRRRRGLSASVIHLGPVFGIGYTTRATAGPILGRLTMQTGGFTRTSERDFHQLFAEAVLAGRPDSTGPIELVSGIGKIEANEDVPPVWHSWPQMSHFVKPRIADEPMSCTSTHSKASAKSRLARAQSRSQAYDVIWDSFTHQLELYFQLELSHINKTELGGMRLDSMGMDSLTAVEIRGWFMKTLEVNMPVLKIMNGGTVGGLVAAATDSIPPRLLPGLEDRSSETDGSDRSGSRASLSDVIRRPDHFALSGPRTTSNGSAILKSIPISPTQARFYPSGLFLEDKVGLNHTTWARVLGRIEIDRFSSAVEALGKQHAILRTAFFDHGGKQLQHILEDTTLHLEHQEISQMDDVERIAMAIQKSYVYDLGQGDTMRLVLLTHADENYLIASMHPLVADATSIPTLLKWLSVHYMHPGAEFPVKQFSEASQEQLALCAEGQLDAEWTFWRREFATMPPPLPLMSLAAVDERPVLKAYENVRAGCRINAGLKGRVLDLCRRMQATPFHFYLATLRVLLLQFTAGAAEDVTIAVAESGRSYDANDMDVIGPLYNLVLVRTTADSSTKFEELLAVTRDKVLAALDHCRLPYTTLVDELGLQRQAKDFPFVQVFADYRMGQRETTQWGPNNQVVMMGLDLNVPYDVYLDTIDEAGGDCIHEFFLRKDLFGKPEADRFAKDYEQLIRAVVEQPDMAVEGLCVPA